MEWDPQLPDRRKEPRYEARAKVRVVISGRNYMGQMRNISGGGMEILIPKEVNPTSQITVYLQLHHDFVFNGVIVWTLGDFKNNKWVYRVGIKTDSIVYNNNKVESPEDKRNLIKRLLPSILKLNQVESLTIENAA